MKYIKMKLDGSVSCRSLDTWEIETCRKLCCFGRDDHNNCRKRQRRDSFRLPYCNFNDYYIVKPFMNNIKVI